jgi:hypothetical protein
VDDPFLFISLLTLYWTVRRLGLKVKMFPSQMCAIDFGDNMLAFENASNPVAVVIGAHLVP